VIKFASTRLAEAPLPASPPPLSPASKYPGTSPPPALTSAQLVQARYLSRPGWVAEHRLVLIALVLVFMLHGGLLLAGSYQRTYDAYVHIFFADHYARWWWSSWDPRWYTGFSTVSYPPGSHQSIALLSKVIGLRAGFVVVQVFALLNCTVGIYRWAQIWVDRKAAGWAAIAFVFSSSIAETVHVFGQLPTTFSLGFLLNSMPFAYRWVRTGSGKALLLGVSATAACTAGHHVTTLFGSVFFVGPVLLAAVVDELRTPRPDEPAGAASLLTRGLVWPTLARRLRRILGPFVRAGTYGFLLGCALLIVVLPYWLFSHSDPILQVSIPHASRDNYLVNRAAGLVFWLIPWGTTLVVLPYAVIRGLSSRVWPLAMSLCLLTFLGTGGTTPYPRMLLGGAFDVLTLDRFTFWATISVLPMVGLFVDSITVGTLRQVLLQRTGRRMSAILPILLLIAHLTFTTFSMNLTHYRPFQPATIDVKPIVAFLNKDDHSKWRYITLGFGDQMAWLGANTLATTVDGNYHSARRLPELTSRPVERLEGAKYSGVPGIGSLQQFLAVPERYSLKYAFVNDHFYDPLLHFSGWVDLGPLENGIEVWDRADVPPLAGVINRQVPLWQRLLWGILPPGALANCLLLYLWSLTGEKLPRPAERLIRRAGRLLARTPPGRIGPAVDRRLLRAVSRLPDATERSVPQRWQPWRPLIGRVRGRGRRMVSVRRRKFTALMIGLSMLLGLVATVRPMLVHAEPTPEDLVFGYYDDLDFRRFPEAYARLNPATRPAYGQYVLDLARDGGLVASFAKLSEIRVKTVEDSPQRVVVRTTIVYLTALAKYSSVEQVELRRNRGKWGIELPQADPTQPPEQFSSRETIRYISQSRRQVTSGRMRATDTADRPQLALSDVKSLRVHDRWVVIGSVTNVDVDPADVTVTAQMRDKDHELLSQWNATDEIQHQLLPGETSPFRIEFQSIAGISPKGAEAKGGSLHVTEDGDSSQTQVVKEEPAKIGATVPLNGPVEFDPTSIVPLALPAAAKVASIDVIARGVVTSRNLSRGLQLLDIHLTHDSSGADRLTGRLRNDTPDEIAIPHLLISYFAADGTLSWLDHAYLPHSIGTQRETTFDVPVSTNDGLTDTGIPTSAFAGSAHALPAHSLPMMITTPTATGFAGLSVMAGGYVRGSAS
jgi:hypothetical protein